MMKGINFHAHKPPLAESPNRMDIACFVGFVDYRADAQRDDIDEWLYQQSWRHSNAGYRATYHRDSADELLDVPVPIESWERFSQLYAWNERDYGHGLKGAGYLAASVRSFFAQGGRKCYVVRVGSPPPADLNFALRQLMIDLLVPGFATRQISIQASNRNSWQGVGHLLGLPDVALLCMPDLPDLLRAELSEEPIEAPAEVYAEERFVECSDPAPTPAADSLLTDLTAPGCSEAGFQKWAEVIHQVALFISRQRRDVQLVASVPLPNQEINNLFKFFHDQGFLDGMLESTKSTLEETSEPPMNIASSFVQLAYPWLETAGSNWLPQRLEPAEGTLAGMLASNAMARGAYRSITGLRQSDISAVHPRLSREAMHAIYSKEATLDSLQTPLISRVSLFGDSINSVTLLSDVTTSNSAAHRPANVNRIISMVLRATRQLGEDSVFENNGEALWADITQRLSGVLGTLFKLGALRGKEPDDAFFVRCDRSTMSQQDLDSGRVIALIHFEPAASIESIDVVLNMRQNGQLALQSIGIEQVA